MFCRRANGGEEEEWLAEAAKLLPVERLLPRYELVHELLMVGAEDLYEFGEVLPGGGTGRRRYFSARPGSLAFPTPAWRSTGRCCRASTILSPTQSVPAVN